MTTFYRYIKGLFIALPVLFAGISFAQKENESYIISSGCDSLKPGALSAGLVNNNFVKNNEYFGKFTKGITYIGSIIQPEITYAFSGKAGLTVGWYARYFYGLEKINQSLPVIRFDYRFIKGGRMIFGQLQGQFNHRLIEPLYSSDNYFEKNPENGLQLIIDKSGINADIWLDWEHFLLPGDSNQEQITAGLNLSYKLINKEPVSVKACLQSVIHHHGGQVDVMDTPLQTRLNIAPGLIVGYSPDSRFVTGASLSAWLVQALDQSPTPTLRYLRGYGIYTAATAENPWATVMAAWWHGKDYFSPLGDYLFQSVSELDPFYHRNTRDLLNMKLLLNREIARGVKAGFRFETYHDLRKNQIDFCYGLNILAQAGWGCKSKKK
ncbi:MAG TPA: hypothetical protein PKI35_11365 [Bacteroidales bacterium]|nr:hypothetical protein [Bacteroidales bacterium]